VNFTLEPMVIEQLMELVKEFKDVFAWTYKDLTCIPLENAQHNIELDTIIPLVHQTKYQLNPNYAAIIKQNIDKLLVAGFIKLVEDTTWLLLIVVIPKKNGKLRIYVDFKKFNMATKKDPYTLPFINEVIHTIVEHEVYTFLERFLGYH
jgi:hypothetical protein